MVKRLVRYIKKIRIKNYPWLKLGDFLIGDNFIVISPECIKLGDGFYAESNLRLQAWKIYESQTFEPRLEIGNHVSMMENCQISCCNHISIGDGCLFGANVFISDNFHGGTNIEEIEIEPRKRELKTKGEVIIGKNVWIGRNVCIMPGVTIGDSCIIGANAVVTKSFSSNTVIGGVPAKTLKQLNSG